LKIIGDTSVWYNLGEGKISIDKSDAEQLVGNYLVVSELVYTKRMEEDFPKVKCAINALMEAPEIIWHVPFEHILLLEFPDRQVRFSENAVMSFEFLRRIYRGWKPDYETMQYLKISSVAISANKKNSSNSVNQLLVDIRGKIKSKTKHLNGSNIESNRKWVLSLISQYGKSEVSSLSETTWKQIEFFTGILDLYFRKLETEKGMKFRANDWFDFLMMIYVQPGDKFWTSETKWCSLVKDNSILEKYFYASKES